MRANASQVIGFVFAMVSSQAAAQPLTLQFSDGMSPTPNVLTVADGDSLDADATPGRILVAAGPGPGGTLAAGSILQVTNFECRETGVAPLAPGAGLKMGGPGGTAGELRNTSVSGAFLVDVMCTSAPISPPVAVLWKTVVEYQGSADDPTPGNLDIAFHFTGGDGNNGSLTFPTASGPPLVGVAPGSQPVEWRTVVRGPKDGPPTVDNIRVFYHAALDAGDRVSIKDARLTVTRAGRSCTARKINCERKKTVALLKCHSDAEKYGFNPLDNVRFLECVQKARDKFDGGLDPERGCFEKAEAKFPATSTAHCSTFDDTVCAEVVIDNIVDDLVSSLDPGYPTPVTNPCSAHKKKCTSKLANDLFKCQMKANKRDTDVDPICVQKAREKLEDRCFPKLDLKFGGNCLTSNDAGSIADAVDARVSDLVLRLDPGPCE